VLYWQRPTAEALARTPWLKETDFVEPSVDVWDENWLALCVFVDNMTQWRVGSGGPIGLDYNVIHTALARKNLSDAEFDAAMQDIGIMERAALLEMRSNS
jgi:hypothetical protein